MIKPEGVKIHDKSYWFILNELEPFPEPEYKRLCDFYLDPQPVYDSRTWTTRSGLTRQSIVDYRSILGQSHYYQDYEAMRCAVLALSCASMCMLYYVPV